MEGQSTWPENTPLREAVRRMPLEAILLETDSPFQKPFGYCEKLNTSHSLVQIANEIAALKGIKIEEMLNTTYENSVRFFGLGKDK
ncbi:TatD family hydrolase [Butyrivibrio sp. ob235]|uniref:TatD family hydrolase n=1 Tax=Butyrivibrio sp. ob235 TaxID=1761780 RepID=UPI0024201AA1|nr:TatD family hydrolase [Butyrivibrio sp. ob235]